MVTSRRTILTSVQGSDSDAGLRVIQAIIDMSRGRDESDRDSDESDDRDDDLYEQLTGFSAGYNSCGSDDHFERDLTACDRECGYCGRCPY